MVYLAASVVVVGVVGVVGVVRVSPRIAVGDVNAVLVKGTPPRLLHLPLLQIPHPLGKQLFSRAGRAAVSLKPRYVVAVFRTRRRRVRFANSNEVRFTSCCCCCCHYLGISVGPGFPSP